MTLKALAHAVRETLQARAGCEVRHSHVHELLAAAFGHRSWAAFLCDALLVEGGIGEPPAVAGPLLVGRALQLQYGASDASAIAQGLREFVAEHRLGALRWDTLERVLIKSPGLTTSDALDGDEDEDNEESPDGATAASPEPVVAPSREQLLACGLLVDGLRRASPENPHAHHMLASLYRCTKPNAYLYQESLKGRVLSAAERGWVEDYQRQAPRYQQYELHLKAAALAGVRAAALEYGVAFERPEFIAMAERLPGDVDALHMSRVASTPEARRAWLRKAAEAGSRTALEALAADGDPWAEERVAAWAGVDWLRRAALRALEEGDASRAWTWQYVALARGADLTRSTLAARHDGGMHDGEFYDSDFGGPLYVDGVEGLVLPDLAPAARRSAKVKARNIVKG